MTTLIVTNRDGETREIEPIIGRTLMEVLRDNDYDELQAICGGNCSCATCHVYVSGAGAGTLPPISEDEDELLGSSSHRTDESRLSCQVKVTPDLNGMHVRIAPED